MGLNGHDLQPADPAPQERWDDGPARQIATDRPGTDVEVGVALCLSGGGFRAMLFHTGVLWRLNELGLLPRLSRVSSVSGGSITAGVLASAWSNLAFDTHGTSQRFRTAVVEPIRRLASWTIDIPAIIRGLLLPGGVSRRVASAYRRHLFGNRTLADLPDAPRFVINATSLQSGVLWRFSKPYMWDYRVGKVVDTSRVTLATAVAASSAFPPFLSPCRIKFRPADFVPGTGTDLDRDEYHKTVLLSDGGVYDNMGIETAWKRYRTILIADAGGAMAAEPHVRRNWASQVGRVLSAIDNQVRSLRKRNAIEAFKAGTRQGAYWSIRGDVRDYRAPDTLPCPHDQTIRLAEEPTRLRRIEAAQQERLINWGYAMTDAAIRAWFDRSAVPPTGFPYPDRGVGQ